MNYENAIKVYPEVGDPFIIELPASVNRKSPAEVEAWLVEYVNLVDTYEPA